MKKLTAILLILIFTLGICNQAFARDTHIFSKTVDLEKKGVYKLIKWRGAWHNEILWEIRTPFGTKKVFENDSTRPWLLRLQDKLMDLSNSVYDLKSINTGEAAVFIGVGISILSGGTLLAAGSVLIGAGITAGGTTYAVLDKMANHVMQIRDCMNYLPNHV